MPRAAWKDQSRPSLDLDMAAQRRSAGNGLGDQEGPQPGSSRKLRCTEVHNTGIRGTCGLQ